jgi:serine/alanine adding enzyme
LLQQTYKNAKIPLADVSLFESAFDILTPKNRLKFFLAKYNTEYIGGIMAPMYKGVISEWYVCGSRAHSKLYSSEMVTWHPIEWGSENGYHTFDFLGAGKPDEEYGVREFKRQFGVRVVNYGRYKKVYSQKKMWFSDRMFKIYRKLFIRN